MDNQFLTPNPNQPSDNLLTTPAVIQMLEQEKKKVTTVRIFLIVGIVVILFLSYLQS